MDKCLVCPTEFARHYVRKGQRQLYCSKSCRFSDGYVIRECPTCGKDYRVHKFHLHRRPACSLSCLRRDPCILCGAVITGRKTYQSGPRRFCSRQCAALVNFNGRTTYKVAGFTATIKRSSKLACERCGDARPEVLEVHHRDRNRKNNADENLETVCASCHSLEHRRGSAVLAHAIAVAYRRAALLPTV